MRLFTYIAFLICCVSAQAQLTVIKTSQFPVSNSVVGNDRILVVTTNTSPTTNYTVPYSSFVSSISNSIGASLKVVTPQMFGAVADGVTDDTTFIQAASDFVALTDSAPSVLYFPVGSYKITSPIILRSNATEALNTRKWYSWVGNGGLSPLISTITNGYAISFVTTNIVTAGLLNHFKLQNICLTNAFPGTNNTSVGVYIGRDMSQGTLSQTAAFDVEMERCQVYGFKYGVIMNDTVQAKLFNSCVIEQCWWTSVLFTNSDTAQIDSCALGDPAAGVDNSNPLSFTNRAAIETWLGQGLRITSCEIGRVSRAVYDRSSPLVIVGGNVEGCYQEGVYAEGVAARISVSGTRIVSVGDGTTNYPIFHLDNGAIGQTTISSVNLDAANRLVAADDIFAYAPPSVVGINLSAVPPVRFNSSYYSLTNATSAIWKRNGAINTSELTFQMTNGVSPSPTSVSSAAYVGSNSVGYIGFTVPYGQGFTTVVSTLSFTADSGSTNMQCFVSPESYHFSNLGLVTDNAGSFYPVTHITNGLINSISFTNTWLNDTSPRELWFKFYGSSGAATVTNKLWVLDCNIQSSP